MLGEQGTRFYVNSAAAIGRDAVDSLFRSAADWHGSIPMTMVEEELGPDAVVGCVAIRREFEALYAAATGTEVGAERARQLLRNFKKTTWHRLPATFTSSLSAYAVECAETRAAGVARRSENLI